MASSIERHYGHRNLHATSVHPGVILDTELPRHQTNDSLDKDFNMEAMCELLGGLLRSGRRRMGWIGFQESMSVSTGYIHGMGNGTGWGIRGEWFW